MNILDEWNKKMHYRSSQFYLDRISPIINRDLVTRTNKSLIDFFGKSYFKIGEKSQKYARIENPRGSNWLFSLLLSETDKSAKQVFELGSLLEFYKDEEVLLKDLKGSYRNKNFRNFRNYLFEIFIYKILDFNKVQNEKQVKEGTKKLEGICIINGEECLFECKKLYLPESALLANLTFVCGEINRVFNKLTFPLVGCISIENDDKHLRNNIAKIIEKHIRSINKEGDKFEINEKFGNSELILQNYESGRFPQLEKIMLLEKKKAAIIFQLCPVLMPDSNIPQKMEFMHKIYTEFTDVEVANYLIEGIKKKRKNRSNSKYKYRIYFFENENYLGLDMGLIPLKGITPFIRKQIMEYLNSKDTCDIVVFVLRDNVNQGSPRIKTEVLYREDLEDIGKLVKNLQFDLFV